MLQQRSPHHPALVDCEPGVVDSVTSRTPRTIPTAAEGAFHERELRPENSVVSWVYQAPQASTVRPEFGTPSHPEQDSFVPKATPQASRQLCPSPNSIPHRSEHDALFPCGTPHASEQDSFVPAHKPHASTVALLNKMPSHPTQEEFVPGHQHQSTREPGRIERRLRQQ